MYNPLKKIQLKCNIEFDVSKPENLIDAEKKYLTHIERGDVSAMNNLACVYHINKKYNEAEKLFLRAIEYNNVYVMNNLACLYTEQKNLMKQKNYY